MLNLENEPDSSASQPAVFPVEGQKDTQDPIAAILVVGFHHSFGPILEFSHPPLPGQEEHKELARLELPEEWSFLPFLALPDGAHLQEEDFSYFHLPPVARWPVAQSTLFGISCNRQIKADQLINKPPDVTRSTVQKAIIVLAREPLFGPIREKLATVTKAWFAQEDFPQTDILFEFYTRLNISLAGEISDSSLFIKTSLRKLIHKFRHRILTLLKLLLLEKRIMFYGHPVEDLCTFQYSLISLIPGLLRHLEYSGSPQLTSSSPPPDKASPSLTVDLKDRTALHSYMGLPLNPFQSSSFFQPYLPLQQIDLLKKSTTSSYLVGMTNQLILQPSTAQACKIDVLVDIERGTIEYFEKDGEKGIHFFEEKREVGAGKVSLGLPGVLEKSVGLTMADRRWVERAVVGVVEKTWDENDSEALATYDGSEDYIRAMFEMYILSLLSTVKHAQAAEKEELIEPPPDDFEFIGPGSPTLGSDAPTNVVPESETSEKTYLSDYNSNWIREWRKTQNYRQWDENTNDEIYQLYKDGHPGHADLSIEDIQEQITRRLRTLNLDQNYHLAKSTLSKAVSTSSATLGKAVSSGGEKLSKALDIVWHEFEKGIENTEENSKGTSFLPSNQLERTSQKAGQLLSSGWGFLRKKQQEVMAAAKETFEQSSINTQKMLSTSQNYARDSMSPKETNQTDDQRDLFSYPPKPLKGSFEHNPSPIAKGGESKENK